MAQTASRAGRSAASERMQAWRVALGHEPADLLVVGGRIVDVHTGEIYRADVAVRGRRIAAVGKVADLAGPATAVYDAAGRVLVPGFIEGHIHATGCFCSLTELARVFLVHGTTVVCTDLYEAAVVGGLAAKRFALDELRRTPLKVLLTVGYQSYLQNMKFGHTGAFGGEELLEAFDWPECVGLSEWLPWMIGMDDPYVREVFRRLWARRQLLVGHAHSYPPGLVQAYAAAGADSDHEALSAEDALEKLRHGYWVMMKENHAVFNARAIIRLLTQRRVDPRRLMLSTDHGAPEHFAREGHMDHQIRVLVREGADPVQAVRMATLNAAEYFRIQDDHGSLAPGKVADIVVLDDLSSVRVAAVVADGRLVAERGEYVAPLEPPAYPESWRRTVRVGRPLQAGDFRIAAGDERRHARVRVIGLSYPVVRTEAREARLAVVDGELRADPAQDVLKVCVVDRHHASGRIGRGFVQGFGFATGAVASTFNPGVHDLCVVGTNDVDMAVAANRIQALGGGLVAAADGEVIGEVPLPLLGVMSDAPLPVLVEQIERLTRVIDARLRPAMKHIFRPMGAIAHPRAIPSLKICAYGLVMAGPDRQEAVELILE